MAQERSRAGRRLVVVLFWFAVIFAVAFPFLRPSTQADQAEKITFTRADLDLNGVVDERDLECAQAYFAGERPLAAIEALDLLDDGMIDFADLVALVRIVRVKGFYEEESMLVVRGDVDDDGYVDERDLALLGEVVGGGVPMLAPMDAADVDANGLLERADYYALRERLDHEADPIIFDDDRGGGDRPHLGIPQRIVVNGSWYSLTKMEDGRPGPGGLTKTMPDVIGICGTHYRRVHNPDAFGTRGDGAVMDAPRDGVSAPEVPSPRRKIAAPTTPEGGFEAPPADLADDRITRPDKKIGYCPVEIYVCGMRYRRDPVSDGVDAPFGPEPTDISYLRAALPPVIDVNGTPYSSGPAGR